ncbi:MAG: NADH-quinone oxidoreductase subunit J [Acidobacteria bacterium ADurb.Bin340]|jgi:NADH-quinone oxidoreductase subunit J|nr:MAG: NADH-quinone oxidoreductase subunit J [Acidobacteria bacterium ADurb.Bin340]HQL48047.1 NADH-quinone oxidoreductase subunit J [Holophaga sp.]
MEAILSRSATYLFLLFGFIALGGAASMVFARNAVHSVIGFLVAMLAVAACYLTLQAEFLGVAQILVYAGGIVVLFLFVVMLVELTKFKEKRLFQIQTPWAVATVLVAVAAFGGVFWKTLFGPAAVEPLTLRPELAEGLKVAEQNAQALSRGLYADFLLPFEILSVILLVALVGAVVLAKTERV